MTDVQAQGRRISLLLFFGVAALYWLLGMHFFMHNPGGSSFYLPFNMVGWAFVSLLIGIGLWQVGCSQRLYFSRLQAGLWGGFALLLIPLFAHSELAMGAGVPKMLGIAAGLLLLFALSQLRLVREQRLMLLYLLLGAVVIEAALGLVQYFLLTPGNWIGYNTLINRPYGIFQKDSVLSSFLALGISVALYVQFYPVKKLSSWQHIVTGCVLFASSLLLVLIQSRAGQYGALGAAILLCAAAYKSQPKRVGVMLMLMLSGLAIGFWVFTGGRSTESYALTIDYRLLYWRHCLELFLQAPWFGHGYGMFESVFVNDYYAIPRSLSGARIIEQNLDHPHNEILYWLVEGGVVAVLGLVTMVWAWFRTLRFHAWSKRVALFALPLPLLFHAMVEYPFYHSVAHWTALICLLWFTDEESEDIQGYSCRFDFLLRSLAILVPLVTVPFMATGIQTAYLVTQFERGGMKDFTLLERVINPLPWFSRFMYDVMSIRLINAMPTHNTGELQAFVAWAKEFNAVQPRSQLYWNGALALDALQQPEEAARWRAEGARLFPADPLFKPRAVSAAVSAATSAATATASGSSAQH
jgi:O-antigen polymerase